jgi:uncharacterized delta-60 repeat protein
MAVACGLLATRALSSEAWLQLYNGPGNDQDQAVALVVDSHGDVIVAGSSQGPGTAADYATIKYSNAGLPLWTNRYNGPVNGSDTAVAVAVDGEDSVIVTGTSAGFSVLRPVAVQAYATVKYSRDGVALWTNRYSGPFEFEHASALAVDRNNDVLVTGSSSETDFPYFRSVFATVKYSSTGELLWVRRHTLAGFGDGAAAVAVDAGNNVIVTGGSANASFYSDCVTLKYSGAGIPLWTNRYDGPANGEDVPESVAVDANGDVVVTGHSYVAANYGNADYLTLKYSSAGLPLWTNRYGGPGSGTHLAHALAIDRNGGVIVTGEAQGGRFTDYATIKYSAAGLPLWTNRYDGPAGSADVARAVAVDADGNIFVTGFSADASGYADIATLRYTPDGIRVWAVRYDGPGHGNDFVSAVAVDARGHVIVAGSSTVGIPSDYVTIQYPMLQPVVLDMVRLSDRVVLSWPDAHFVLQSAPEVTGPYTRREGATSPHTEPLSDEDRFYRLVTE